MRRPAKTRVRRKAPPRGAKVTAVWNPAEKQLYCLEELQCLSFGRARSSRDDNAGKLHVHISNPYVSMEHCTLDLEDGQWVLHDQSTNGTYINDVEVTQPVPMRVGMYIVIGNREFVTVGEDERVYLKARDTVSLLAHAKDMYGSSRRAEKKVKKSHSSVQRAYRKRFPERIRRKDQVKSRRKGG